MSEGALPEQPLTRARELIRATDGRATRPRLRTLAALLDSEQALSHGELRQRMPDLDRVSLYRSLEWLLEAGLAFRIDAAGQHRYGASHQEQDHHHPHFRCTGCGMTTCLSDVTNPIVRLPRGFRTTTVELLVTGLCTSCGERL